MGSSTALITRGLEFPHTIREGTSRVPGNVKEPSHMTVVLDRPRSITPSNRGRPPKSIANPFFSYIGSTTLYGRYPEFALDVVEGVARLDWHDRPTGSGGKSMPLSVRNIAVVLVGLERVTAESVGEILRIAERHAQRYVKAIELIIPYMMKSRPKSLVHEMNDTYEVGSHEWEDIDELTKPSPIELAKLHHDLRAFGSI